MDTPNQRAFDIAVRHMAKQKVFSASDRADIAACAYRNAAGHKCVAGAMIAEGRYDAAYEGLPVQRLPQEALIPEVRGAAPLFLRHLQKCHDNAYEDGERVPGPIFRRKMMRLAKESLLDTSALDEHFPV